jgi:sodium transport system permease protein
MTPEPPVAARVERRLDWRQVWILYRREMRAAFRERTIVLNSILLPVFLYPFLLWAAMTGLMFVMGQTEGFVSRIAVEAWPKEHPGLRNRLERDTHFLLANSATNAVAQLKTGSLDALLELVPAQGEAAALPGNFVARVTFNKAKERSAEARARLTEAIDEYRAGYLKRTARARGIDAATWQGFTLSSVNEASKREMGTFILGLVAPLIFVVMVAVGCFYPAVDALAGERERNTWETLISTSASRLSVVTAKYLCVASLGGLAGLLNLTAVMLTMRPIFGPLLEKAGKVIECTIPLAALPVAALVAVLLAAFIAAGMMIFAVFARTFKEGQAMITPFYMLILVPVVFLQAPGIKFTPALACAPIINLTMMVREALAGRFPWLEMGISVVVSLALVGLALKVAAYILEFEDVLVGSYAGSFGRFFKQRMLGRRRKGAAAEGRS